MNKNNAVSLIAGKIAVILLLVQGLWTASAVAASIYSITDLGALTNATAINASGQVVGNFRVGGNTHAFLYSGGQMQDLGALSGGNSYATAVNDAGIVAGYARIAGQGNNPGHAFLWDGSMHDLGTLPDGPYSQAYGINNNGEVVGYSDLGTPAGIISYAFLYTGGAMNNIGKFIFPGCGTTTNCRSWAYDINNNGQVAGYSGRSSGPGHAFLYDVATGNAQDLGVIGSAASASEALAVNDAGQVTGYGNPASSLGYQHTFLYSGGAMQDLGTLGGNDSRGYAINNSGQVVGTSQFQIGNGSFHAFIYTDGQMADLNTLLLASTGWTLTAALGVNDAGQIVGNGLLGGSGHAFLLTPTVPIPGAFWLFGSALIGLIGFGGRRKGRGPDR